MTKREAYNAVRAASRPVKEINKRWRDLNARFDAVGLNAYQDRKLMAAWNKLIEETRRVTRAYFRARKVWLSLHATA